ncbi:MAG: hypothetical protein AAF570_06425, partial [Bacteroidota bacterium]
VTSQDYLGSGGPFPFAGDFFVQHSTDGRPPGRDDRTNNQIWAKRLHNLQMDYEAFTIQAGALGILDNPADCHPTTLAFNPPFPVLAPREVGATADASTLTLHMSWRFDRSVTHYEIFVADSLDAFDLNQIFAQVPALPGPDGRVQFSQQVPPYWHAFVVVRAVRIYRGIVHHSLPSGPLEVATAPKHAFEILDINVPIGDLPSRLHSGHIDLKNVGWAPMVRYEPLHDDHFWEMGLYVRTYIFNVVSALHLEVVPEPGIGPGETGRLPFHFHLPYSRQRLRVDLGPGFRRDGANWGYFGGLNFNSLPDGTPILVNAETPYRRAMTVIDARGLSVDVGAGETLELDAEKVIRHYVWSLRGLSAAPEGTVIRTAMEVVQDGAQFSRRLRIWHDASASIKVEVQAAAVFRADTRWEYGRYVDKTFELAAGASHSIGLARIEGDFGWPYMEILDENLAGRAEIVMRRVGEGNGAGEMVVENRGNVTVTVRVHMPAIFENVPANTVDPRVTRMQASNLSFGATAHEVLEPATDHRYYAAQPETAASGRFSTDIVLLSDGKEWHRALEVTAETAVPLARASALELVIQETGQIRDEPGGTDDATTQAEAIAALLDFLNQAESAEAIVARIADDPGYGAASPRAYGIRLSTAERLLEARKALPDARFSHLDEVDAVKGIGPDTLHDMVQAFM